VRLLRRLHDVETFEVIKVLSPEEDYLKHLRNEFHADIQRFNPGVSVDDAARTSAQVDLDYVVPRYQGFTLGEFVYRFGGPPPRSVTVGRSRHPGCRTQVPTGPTSASIVTAMTCRLTVRALRRLRRRRSAGSARGSQSNRRAQGAAKWK
jgi:hypothetical protein